MAQLNGWNKLKFQNDGEYYELCKHSNMSA